jgi:hypothetical protein
MKEISIVFLLLSRLEKKNQLDKQNDDEADLFFFQFKPFLRYTLPIMASLLNCVRNKDHHV